MDQAIGSAVLAVVHTVPLLAVLFLPYVAWTYRSQGRLGLRPALAAAAGVLWVAALWAYTILPVPEGDACLDPVEPQLRPFAFVGDIDARGIGLLRDPALLQVLLNVLLFVPLGVAIALLVRRRRLLAGALVGLGVSLSVELVQLTGTLGVYDCAYRLFDVDDLIANTLGAVVGVGIGPIVRRVVGRRPQPAALDRLVTLRRRILGIAIDGTVVAVSLLVVSVAVGLGYQASGDTSFEDGLGRAGASDWVSIGPVLLLLVVVPVLTRGLTVGRWAVSIRPVTVDRERPTRARALANALAGLGGLATVLVLRSALSVGAPRAWLGLLLTGWAVAAVVLVIRPGHRGLSGVVSATAMLDARHPDLLERDRGAGRRRPLAAIRVVSVAAFALYAGLLAAVWALRELGGREGVALLAPVLGTLVASQVVASGYLVGNGLVMLHREGRSLGNLLSLLAGLASFGLVLVGLVVVLIAGDVLRTVVLVLSVLASFGALVFIGLVLVGRDYGRTPTTGDVDVLIVLGSRVVAGRVPPLLAARLRTAEDVRHEVLQRGGDPLVICTGGRGPDEITSEGSSMREWLLDRGLPADRVLAEEEARTTRENLVLSMDLARARGAGRAPVLVTNGYHVFRAALLAEDLGLDVRVAAGPTAPYFLPSALLREHIAVLLRTLGLQAVLGALLAVGAVLATTL